MEKQWKAYRLHPRSLGWLRNCSLRSLFRPLGRERPSPSHGKVLRKVACTSSKDFFTEKNADRRCLNWWTTGLWIDLWCDQTAGKDLSRRSNNLLRNQSSRGVGRQNKIDSFFLKNYRQNPQFGASKGPLTSPGTNSTKLAEPLNFTNAVNFIIFYHN